MSVDVPLLSTGDLDKRNPSQHTTLLLSMHQHHGGEGEGGVRRGGGGYYPGEKVSDRQTSPGCTRMLSVEAPECQQLVGKGLPHSRICRALYQLWHQPLLATTALTRPYNQELVHHFCNGHVDPYWVMLARTHDLSLQSRRGPYQEASKHLLMGWGQSI